MALTNWADEIRKEEKLLLCRFIWHTRPKRELSLEEALELCERTAEVVGRGNIENQLDKFQPDDVA